MKKKQIALVHDFLLYPGGAERVFVALAELFPDAPIYTLLYDSSQMDTFFHDREVRTSFLQKLPQWIRKSHTLLAPFYPSAVESLDLHEFDVIISSSGAWTKGLVTKLKTQHIAYIHSPMRFVWDYNERYLQQRAKRPSLCTRVVLGYLRLWDKLASDRPEMLIANSLYTKERIKKYYRRDAQIIYPPVRDMLGEYGIDWNNNDYERDIFLVVSRLSAYKQIDRVIETFNKLKLPLVIIGSGGEEKKLRALAGPTIHILGYLSDEKVVKYFQRARAFIFAGEDDFGIAPVEAMSVGIPIIAYRAGGITEAVQEGVHGEFFDAQKVEMIADAVRRFLEKEGSYDRAAIRNRGLEFSKERFQKNIVAAIDKIA